MTWFNKLVLTPAAMLPELQSAASTCLLLVIFHDFVLRVIADIFKVVGADSGFLPQYGNFAELMALE